MRTVGVKLFTESQYSTATAQGSTKPFVLVEELSCVLVINPMASLCRALHSERGDLP